MLIAKQNLVRQPILATLIGLASVAQGATTDRGIEYFVTGEGHSETVVLIHGFNDSHETWGKVVPRLAQQFRVVTYDQPGHGDSKANGSDYSPKRMARELSYLMNYLNIETAHIVGHSMGGRTALQFAADFPERVDRLVVEDMSAMAIDHVRGKLALSESRFGLVQKELPRVFSGWVAASTAVARYYSPQEKIFILGAAKQSPTSGFVRLGNRPEVTAMYLYQGLTQDMTAELKAIKSPLKFFAADPWSVTTQLRSQGIAHIQSVRPDVAVQIFPGAGHSIHKRPEFTKALLNFLQAAHS